MIVRCGVLTRREVADHLAVAARQSFEYHYATLRGYHLVKVENVTLPARVISWADCDDLLHHHDKMPYLPQEELEEEFFVWVKKACVLFRYVPNLHHLGGVENGVRWGGRFYFGSQRCELRKDDGSGDLFFFLDCMEIAHPKVGEKEPPIGYFPTGPQKIGSDPSPLAWTLASASAGIKLPDARIMRERIKSENEAEKIGLRLPHTVPWFAKDLIDQIARFKAGFGHIFSLERTAHPKIKKPSPALDFRYEWALLAISHAGDQYSVCKEAEDLLRKLEQLRDTPSARR